MDRGPEFDASGGGVVGTFVNYGGMPGGMPRGRQHAMGMPGGMGQPVYDLGTPSMEMGTPQMFGSLSPQSTLALFDGGAAVVDQDVLALSAPPDGGVYDVGVPGGFEHAQMDEYGGMGGPQMAQRLQQQQQMMMMGGASPDMSGVWRGTPQQGQGMGGPMMAAGQDPMMQQQRQQQQQQAQQQQQQQAMQMQAMQMQAMQMSPGGAPGGQVPGGGPSGWPKQFYVMPNGQTMAGPGGNRMAMGPPMGHPMQGVPQQGGPQQMMHAMPGHPYAMQGQPGMMAGMQPMPQGGAAQGMPRNPASSPTGGVQRTAGGNAAAASGAAAQASAAAAGPGQPGGTQGSGRANMPAVGGRGRGNAAAAAQAGAAAGRGQAASTPPATASSQPPAGRGASGASAAAPRIAGPGAAAILSAQGTRPGSGSQAPQRGGAGSPLNGAQPSSSSGPPSSGSMMPPPSRPSAPAAGSSSQASSSSSSQPSRPMIAGPGAARILEQSSSALDPPSKRSRIEGPGAGLFSSSSPPIAGPGAGIAGVSGEWARTWSQAFVEQMAIQYKEPEPYLFEEALQEANESLQTANKSLQDLENEIAKREQEKTSEAQAAIAQAAAAALEGRRGRRERLGGLPNGPSSSGGAGEGGSGANGSHAAHMPLPTPLTSSEPFFQMHIMVPTDLTAPFKVTEAEAAKLEENIRGAVERENWLEAQFLLSDPRCLNTSLFKEPDGRYDLRTLLTRMRRATSRRTVSSVFHSLLLAMLKATEDFSKGDALQVVEQCHSIVAVFTSELRVSAPDLFDISFEEAMLLLNKARNICMKADGEFSVLHARCLNLMGVTLLQHSHYKEALEAWHEGWAILTRARVVKDPNEAEILRNLGEAYALKEDYQRAEFHLSKTWWNTGANQAKKDVLFEASVYQVYGAIAFRQCKYKKALSYFSKIIDLKRQYYQPEHPDIYSLMYVRACIYFHQKSFGMAATEYRAAWRLQRGHEAFAQADMDHLRYGLLLIRGGRHQPPLNLLFSLVRFLLGFQISCDPEGETPLIGYTLSHLASLYGEAKMWAKAIATWEKALAMFAKNPQLFPDEHPRMRHIRSCINRANLELRGIGTGDREREKEKEREKERERERERGRSSGMLLLGGPGAPPGSYYSAAARDSWPLIAGPGAPPRDLFAPSTPLSQSSAASTPAPSAPSPPQSQSSSAPGSMAPPPLPRTAGPGASRGASSSSGTGPGSGASGTSLASPPAGGANSPNSSLSPNAGTPPSTVGAPGQQRTSPSGGGPSPRSGSQKQTQAQQRQAQQQQQAQQQAQAQQQQAQQQQQQQMAQAQQAQMQAQMQYQQAAAAAAAMGGGGGGPMMMGNPGSMGYGMNAMMGGPTYMMQDPGTAAMIQQQQQRAMQQAAHAQAQQRGMMGHNGTPLSPRSMAQQGMNPQQAYAMQQQQAQAQHMQAQQQQMAMMQGMYPGTPGPMPGQMMPAQQRQMMGGQRMNARGMMPGTPSQSLEAGTPQLQPPSTPQLLAAMPGVEGMDPSKEALGPKPSMPHADGLVGMLPTNGIIEGVHDDLHAHIAMPDLDDVVAGTPAAGMGMGPGGLMGDMVGGGVDMSLGMGMPPLDGPLLQVPETPGGAGTGGWALFGPGHTDHLG
eukprot:tig00001299_g8062.t2